MEKGPQGVMEGGVQKGTDCGCIEGGGAGFCTGGEAYGRQQGRRATRAGTALHAAAARRHHAHDCPAASRRVPPCQPSHLLSGHLVERREALEQETSRHVGGDVGGVGGGHRLAVQPL